MGLLGIGNCICLKLVEHVGNMSNTTQPREQYIYPVPFWLANLLQQGDSMRAVDQTSHAHPSILQGVSTEHLIKLVRFGIWSKFMVEKAHKFNNISDVLKAELEVFSKSGYGIREDFQVQSKCTFSLYHVNI